MQSIEEAKREYDEIKNKYFMILLPAPLMNIPMLFDTPEEAKRYFLSEIYRQPKMPLEQYVTIQKEIEDTGGALRILNVEKEVMRYEQENQYGEDNFRDRQHFIDVIVFGKADVE